MNFILKYFLFAAISVLMYSCVKDVSVTEPVNDIKGVSKIIITSKPAGALIYLEGKNMGIITPDSLPWLLPGNYELKLKLGLFPDHKAQITIKDSDKLFYFYDYTTDPVNLGSIKCSSSPSGANIILNDSLLKVKTPYTITGLLPGNYKVKFTYALHRADSTYTDVRGSKTNDIYFALEDTSVWVSYNIKNSPLTSNNITFIAVDKYNIKWIGTDDGGVFNFDGKNWTSTNFGNYVSCIYPDKSGSVWVGTYGNVEQYTGKWTDYARFFQSPNVSSITVDNSGVPWVGTDYGIYFFQESKWIGYVFSDETVKLTSPNITAVTVDLAGRIWICTDRGISIYNNGTWKAFFISSLGLPQNVGNSIVDVKADNDGIVWVAHKENLSKDETGGLTKFDGQSWSVVELPGFPTNYIKRIYVDANNYKWICTINGIARFKNPDKLLIYNYSNSKIPGNVITGAEVDAAGDLWVATFGGGIGKLKKNSIPAN